MIKTLPITEARSKLTTLVDRTNRLLEEYIITVRGKPAAVIMSHDEYESWKETNEILSDPKILKNIKKSEAEIKKGNYVTLEQLEEELNV